MKKDFSILITASILTAISLYLIVVLILDLKKIWQ